MKKLSLFFEPLLVVALLLFIMVRDLDDVDFHPDESDWIGTSSAFERVYQSRSDEALSAKRPSYYDYANPPLTYYVVGLARRLGGFGEKDLNLPYRFDSSREQNVAEGRVPSRPLLWWGRLGVTVCASLGILFAFLILRQASGSAVAYPWLFFLLLNSAFMRMLRRAMSEGVLVFFVMASIGAAYFAVKSFVRQPNGLKSLRCLGWLALSGVFAGLAGDAKLNGLMMPLAVWVVFIAAILRTPSTCYAKVQQIVFTGLILASTSLGCFLGANPLLWSNPIEGIKKTIALRVEVTEAHVKKDVNSRLGPLRKRIDTLTRRIFTDQGLLPPLSPNSFFFLAGVILAYKRTLEWGRRSNENHALVTLVIAGFVFGLPNFLTPLDWDRYYLPISFFYSMVTMMGATMIFKWLIREVVNVKG